MLGQLQWKSHISYLLACREYPVKTGFHDSDTDTKADICEALVSVPLPAVPGNNSISCLNVSR